MVPEDLVLLLDLDLLLGLFGGRCETSCEKPFWVSLMERFATGEVTPSVTFELFFTITSLRVAAVAAATSVLVLDVIAPHLVANPDRIEFVLPDFKMAASKSTVRSDKRVPVLCLGEETNFLDCGPVRYNPISGLKVDFLVVKVTLNGSDKGTIDLKVDTQRELNCNLHQGLTLPCLVTFLNHFTAVDDDTVAPAFWLNLFKTISCKGSAFNLRYHSAENELMLCVKEMSLNCVTSRQALTTNFGARFGLSQLHCNLHTPACDYDVLRPCASLVALLQGYAFKQDLQLHMRELLVDLPTNWQGCISLAPEVVTLAKHLREDLPLLCTRMEAKPTRP
ncbi:hypothetical protein Ciccas_014066, partial [Cichlidogyrus casuarinus]